MAVPSTCHWVKGFWQGSSSWSLSLEMKEAGLESHEEKCKPSKPVISTSSSQPAWCWILCPINDWEYTFLIHEDSRAALVVTAPAQQPSWLQPELSYWQCLGHSLFLFLKCPSYAEILLLKLLRVYMKTHFCPLTLWSSWLYCRDPVPLLEQFFVLLHPYLLQESAVLGTLSLMMLWIQAQERPQLKQSWLLTVNPAGQQLGQFSSFRAETPQTISVELDPGVHPGRYLIHELPAWQITPAWG